MNRFNNAKTLNLVANAVMLIICLFALLPFIVISFYNVAGASDDIHHAMFQINRNYFEAVYHWYADGYNGRYTNAIFMQMPGRLFMTNGFAHWFPIIVIALMLVSLYKVFKQFSSQTNRNLLWALLILTYLMAYSPDIIQYFWFSGATVYVIPHVFYFFFLAILIKKYYQQGSDVKEIAPPFTRGQKTTLALLSFFAMGSSEMWMAITLFTMFSFYADALVKSKQWKNIFFIPFLFVLLWTIMVVFSPGTFHRIAAESTNLDNANLFSSLVKSAFAVVEYFNEWFLHFGAFVIVIGLLLRPTNNKFHPLFSSFATFWIVLFAFASIFAGIFIIQYSLGHIRIRALVPIFTYMLFFILLLVERGRLVLSSHVIKDNIKLWYGVSNSTIVVGFLLLMLSSQNIKNVYDDFIADKPDMYKKQVDFVNNYMKQHQNEKIILPAFTTCPSTFYCIKFPDYENWDYWPFIAYHHIKDIRHDKSITMEEFIRFHTTDEGVKIDKANPFFSITRLNRDEIENKKIHVYANVIDKHKVGMLIIDCAPYWKAFVMKDILSSGVIDFSWQLSEEDILNEDIVKVYFYNPNEQPVLIKRVEANIL